MKKLWKRELMYAMDALKQAANKAGISLYRISIDIGKSRQYVNSMITRGSTPQCDTMARMLDVCGFGLYAIPYEDAPKDAIQITSIDDE